MVKTIMMFPCLAVSSACSRDHCASARLAPFCLRSSRLYTCERHSSKYLAISFADCSDFPFGKKEIHEIMERTYILGDFVSTLEQVINAA